MRCGVIKKINGRDWFCCPHCGKALFPVSPETRAEHLALRCKACKHDVQVNIP